MVNNSKLGKHFYDNQLVSVIIPVYNSEKYIRKSVESAISQTYKNIEIILVDDFSTDKSTTIIDDLFKKYNNITCYYFEKNRGVAFTRNKALDLANGRYVAFLDSDDLWYDDKIEKQIELLNKHKAAFGYTAIEMIDQFDNVTKTKRKVISTINYPFLLKNTMIATSSTIIDRNIIGDFHMPLLRSGQDYATWLIILKSGIIAYGINEVLVKYRKSSKSLSSNKFKSLKQVISIQIEQEKIPFFKAYYNGLWFLFNAFKKHFF